MKTIKYHYDLIQGSDEWFAARCGILTASEMKHIITPAKLQYAQNDKATSHLYELLGQRITKYVEPHYISDDMLRGHGDELRAKIIYNEKYAPVQDCGFITNDKWGFTLGYSPDGLIGDGGQIECKSRRQKFQVETLISRSMPVEYFIQVQTGLAVSERQWADFISYSGGLPMYVVRVWPDLKVHQAIIAAAEQFHDRINDAMKEYEKTLIQNSEFLISTERTVEQEITI